VKVEMDSLALDWPAKIGSLVVGAAAHGKNFTANQKVELLKHHQKFGKFLYRLIGISENGGNVALEASHMRRLPVVYAILQTFTKSQDASDTFWRQVRDGEGLRRSMPTYKLRNYLLTHNYGFGRGALGVKVSTFHEMTSKCITAWNAYRKGVATDLKYYISKEIPKSN